MAPEKPVLDRVVLQGVGKRYGRHAALRDVDLEVTQGRCCVVLGDNGAGKSTLLGLVATTLAPSSGRLRHLAGDEELRGRDLRCRLGYVAHQPMIYPELSGLENVAFFARLAGVPRPREAASAVLVRCGLDPESALASGHYSRGMQARLSFARALVTDPELLILDEPFSGIDRAGRLSLLDAIRKAGTSRVLILATHQLEMAAALSEHLAVFRRGRIFVDEELSEADTAARAGRIRRALEDGE